MYSHEAASATQERRGNLFRNVKEMLLVWEKKNKTTQFKQFFSTFVVSDCFPVTWVRGIQSSFPLASEKKRIVDF